jgi:hypothetical protein
MFWLGALAGAALVTSVGFATKMLARQRDNHPEWFAWMPLAQVGFDGRGLFIEFPTGSDSAKPSRVSKIGQQAKLEPIRFSYNYSSWPFVELGDRPSIDESISDKLAHDLTVWANNMDKFFDYEKGFASAEVREKLNAEYLVLSERLKAEGIDNVTDLWWS